MNREGYVYFVKDHPIPHASGDEPREPRRTVRTKVTICDHAPLTRIVCRKPVTSVMWRNAHALDFNNEHTTLLNITVNCYT